MTMKRKSWQDYQKEIADDHYYYARSCIRQNFFLGSEKLFIDMLRNPDYQRAQRKFQQDSTEYQEEGQAKGFTMVGVDPMTLCCEAVYGPAR